MTPDEYIKMNRGLNDYIIPKELRANNFELLKETDYYLIEVSAHPTPEYFAEYMARRS